jgi:hypothetical protein
MRIILLSTAAAILAGCASITPPLCDREEQPWVKFGTTDDTCAAPVAFARPDAGGDGFVMPSSPRPETPIIEPPKPPHLDREDPPAKPEPEKPQPPAEPEKPQPPAEPEPEQPKPEPEKPQPETPKPDKPVKGKDNSGHGNGDEGDCRGKGCSDADNSGKGKE